MNFQEFVSIKMDKMIWIISNPNLSFPSYIFSFLSEHIFVLKCSEENGDCSTAGFFQFVLYSS